MREKPGEPHAFAAALVAVVLLAVALVVVVAGCFQSSLSMLHMAVARPCLAAAATAEGQGG